MAANGFEHTPGPWEVGEEVDSQDRLVYVPIRRGKLHISTTGVYGRKPDGETAGRKYRDRFGTERHDPVITADECRANARLISAAPELLAACHAALSLSDHAEGCVVERANISEMRTREQRAALWIRCDCHIAKLRVAITKATGLDPLADDE